MAAFIENLRTIVGPANLFTGDDIEERFRNDVLKKFRSSPSCVVRPGDTEQVSKIVGVARQYAIPITPLGGGTGVVGGAIASDGGILLSLERMNRIVDLDLGTMTMTVEAGVPLQVAQDLAEEHDLMLPLDLGARGSATIGGNIATNAGGTRVLRWGMARDMVLGLEAVLADGSVVSALGKVLKDNAGYHWKDLLVGSEGTLGIVTRAVLRLRPRLTSAQTAIVAVSRFDKTPALLRVIEARCSGQLSSFELMWQDFYEYVTTAQLALRQRPLPNGYPLYAVIETLGSNPDHDRNLFEAALGGAQSAGLIEDAVIARTERDRANFWAARDDLTEAFRMLFPMLAFDVSLPLKDMHSFVDETREAIRAIQPGATVLYYGHAGDGNLHIAVGLDQNAPSNEHRIEEAVYEILGKFGGSISAEHGVGLGKREFLTKTRSPEEVAMMRAIKHALDPLNIMNPGKIFA